MGRLEGKLAIVTGAGSGIGEATARLMAHEGASVVVADIDRSAAERVAGELGSAVAAEVDVSDESSVVSMVETAVESFGGLDVLHNNATDASTAAADTDIVTLEMRDAETLRPGRCGECRGLPRVGRSSIRQRDDAHGRRRRDYLH